MTRHRPPPRVSCTDLTAAVGLLGVAALNLARESVTHWSYLFITAASLVLSLRTKIHPALLLLGGLVVGALFGIFFDHRHPQKVDLR